VGEGRNSKESMFLITFGAEGEENEEGERNRVFVLGGVVTKRKKITRGESWGKEGVTCTR